MNLSLITVLALCLSACQGELDVSALAADPQRLTRLRDQCAVEPGTAMCQTVRRADLERFLSGEAGACEYRTLEALPEIPPSFDGPADTSASTEERL